ncbi:MAG: DEAD/DEAH box helicase [Acidimicrobiales bacterium]
MARSIKLRPWQRDALDRLEATSGPNFLAVATPGAGKTTFALTAACQNLAANPRRRLVVVVPTQHLKVQWASAANAFGLHLDPSWSAADGRLPSDMHGVITTYQQVASSAPILRGLASDAFVIFDEIHHAADDRAWGDSIRYAFEPAAQRLSLSGTPFRSDTQAIPFIDYHLDEARPDYSYGYREALADGGVVRPVYFPQINGHMEWMGPDGSLHSHSFEDSLDSTHASQRLRAALSIEGEWLPAVLAQAHQRLCEVRVEHDNAGGLIIAMDQEHARAIATLLERRYGIRVTVAVSDDPAASSHIARFAAGTDPWIVAVRMISEGVDIPRLRVGVFATNTTTELFFRQAVGRLVRWTKGLRRQDAYLFIPDDSRLVRKANEIALERNHSLAKVARPEGEGEGFADALDLLDDRDALANQGDDPQLSLFSVISAVAVGAPRVAQPTLGFIGDGESHDDDESLTITLAPLPQLAGDRSMHGGDSGDTLIATRRENKQELRNANNDRVRAIARITGWSHAQVNGELNRLTGLNKVTEATLTQLETRLRHAGRWLSRL